MSKSLLTNKKGFMIVIGLPILIAGFLLIGRGLNRFYTYFVSSNWPAVKADIVSAELQRSINESNNSETTGLKGSFTYEYNNKKYTSNRLDIVGGSNKNHKDKKQKLAFLLAAKAKGQQVDALVNPSDPEYAIIFRELSFDMFAYILVGIIACLLGYFLTRCSRLFAPTPKAKPQN